MYKSKAGKRKASRDAKIAGLCPEEQLAAVAALKEAAKAKKKRQKEKKKAKKEAAAAKGDTPNAGRQGAGRGNRQPRKKPGGAGRGGAPSSTTAWLGCAFW